MQATIAVFADEYISMDVDKSAVRSLLGTNVLDSDLDKAVNDISKIQFYSIPSELLVSVSTDDTGEATYVYQYEDGLVAEIQLKESDDGNVKLKIVEGNKTDELEYCKNGELLYNGDNVMISNDDSGEYTNLLVTANDKVQLRAGREEYITTTCPYGRASEYNVYAGVKKSANVQLGTTFSDATRSGLAAVLAAAIASPLGLPAALLFAFTTGFASSLLDIGVTNDPRSSAVSYTLNQYYHKSSGKFRINTYLSAKKMDAIFYTQVNYRGSMSTGKFYECIDHS